MFQELIIKKISVSDNLVYNILFLSYFFKEGCFGCMKKNNRYFLFYFNKYLQDLIFIDFHIIVN